MFSRGIERDQLYEMGANAIYFLGCFFQDDVSLDSCMYFIF